MDQSITIDQGDVSLTVTLRDLDVMGNADSLQLYRVFLESLTAFAGQIANYLSQDKLKTIHLKAVGDSLGAISGISYALSDKAREIMFDNLKNLQNKFHPSSKTVNQLLDQPPGLDDAFEGVPKVDPTDPPLSL